MIKITYDAQDGIIFTDGRIMPWVEGYLCSPNIKHYEVKVGSELLIHAIRLAIKKGKLDCNDVVFIFNGEEIKADKDGRIAHWPIGFCDYYDSFLSKLLEWE